MASVVHTAPGPKVLRVERSWLARRPWLPLTAPAFALTAILAASLATLVVYSFYSFRQGTIDDRFTLSTWLAVLQDPFFWMILGRTITMAASVTIASLVVGYPIAYGIAKLRRPWLVALVYLIFFSPLIVGIAVRAYGWIILLSDNGVLNGVLVRAGWIDTPLALSFNLTGVEIALVHGSLALMIFPLVSSIRSVQLVFRESAMDLGASRWPTFRRVTLPLTLPGIIAGCQVVFVLSVSAWVTPELIGGGHVITMARLSYEDVTSLNWPRGSVEVFALLSSALVVVLGSNLLARFTYLGHLKVRA